MVTFNTHFVNEQGVNSTYGTIDLGGASTQIAYFLPSQDILEGLYKFQIGNQKIWNVYTKSFLSFGVNSARERHLTGLVDKYLNSLSRSSSDRVDADVSNNAIASSAGASGAAAVHTNTATNSNNNTVAINTEVVAASHKKQKQALQVVNSCFYAGYSEKQYGSDGDTRVGVCVFVFVTLVLRRLSVPFVAHTCARRIQVLMHLHGILH